ncbi:MAG: hypothetical protein Q9157_007255 [Trypethelium eluteriae]
MGLVSSGSTDLMAQRTRPDQTALSAGKGFANALANHFELFAYLAKALRPSPRTRKSNSAKQYEKVETIRQNKDGEADLKIRDQICQNDQSCYIFSSVLIKSNKKGNPLISEVEWLVGGTHGDLYFIFIEVYRPFTEGVERS